MQPAISIQPTPSPEISAARSWFLHLAAFGLPLLTTVFLVTGPHVWWAALLWSVPIWVLVLADTRALPDLRQPAPGTPQWPFDLQVYALTALQLVNHVLLGFMAAKLAISPGPKLIELLANLVAMHSVSGIAAGYSGIVLAHELVHRRGRFDFFLGRLLLMFVCYEQFATEHVRGHHPRIGTREDPATARFGETFQHFLFRTVPQQFKSAWHLDQKRVGAEGLPFYHPRMLKNRVLQGVIAEVLITAAYWVFFGPIAMVFFLLQARMAVVLLEAVNYMEHWGLSRTGKVVTREDSWDTDNSMTLYTLVGLSRHSDHHAQASRPYHMLRRFEESPKMPAGYYGTVVLAMFANKRYQALATAELKRKRLGPFRDGAQPPTASLAPDSLGRAAEPEPSLA
jgi:alkane 1-monooxygenase